MKNRGVIRRLRREDGIASVVVVTCVIALMGAMMLSLDAGNLWSSRRNEITGTDAAALHAAIAFNTGALNPCSTADQATAETDATEVLWQNNTRSLHNPTDTPDGYEVTLYDPALCGVASFVPGKVRYDGRLPSANFFSQIFGINNLSAISSSTAAWGYVVEIGDQLRPIPICDKGENYQLWQRFWNGAIPQDIAPDPDRWPTEYPNSYNSYFGRDALYEAYPNGSPELELIRFPESSNGYINGPADTGSGRNPNHGLAYVPPDGTDGHRTVHRITSPDANCETGADPSGNRAWIDFEDVEGGAAPRIELAEWLERGYPGTVSLDPHDCNPANDNPVPEDCGGGEGDKAALERSLAKITCPVATAARSCPHVFPVVVVTDVFNPGSNVHYVHAAFLYVVLRGYGSIEAQNIQFDFEFLDVTTSGKVSGGPPTTSYPFTKGVQLCGADHDEVEDRCL